MYKSNSWVVLFGGAGRESVINAMAVAGITIRKIIIPQKQSEKLLRSISILRNRSLLIEEVDRSGLRSALLNETNSALLTLGFPYIIPKNIFCRHPISLNVHPTLLPKYRGPTTGAYILINNEKHSGSTVHLLDEDVDKGAIIAQSRVELSPFDTIRSMQRKVYQTEPRLVLEAIDKLDNGYIPVQQDENIATVYSMLRKPEDSLIDAQKPLIELINEIRACDPLDFPAHFYVEGQKVCVRLWRPDKPASEEDMI